ncbi:MAG: Asp-tRNA(Asn)/Glu-tRNA(Gln) amidotransferase subunit GatA [Chlamydia sp.]
MKKYFESSHSLSTAFIENRISAEEIAAFFLERVQSQDQTIGAFLHIKEDLIFQQARALDKKRAEGKRLGLLAGVPVAFKDNISVKNMPLTCASKFLEHFSSPYDSTVAEYIKGEDGIVFGKTNLDEFAMGSSCETSALQKTVNPLNHAFTPGGSSGGSAAAVAAGMVPLSLGSDTGGSVRLPASFCGVTGFKPTYGRISRFGLVAFGSSLDQIGPIARSADEIDHIMKVIGKPCTRDSTALQDLGYSQSVRAPLHKGLKIGVPWQFLEGLNEESKALFMNSLKLLQEKEGATVHEVDLSLLRYSIAIYYILVTAEASTNLARFDGIRYGRRSPNANTLEEIYEISREEGFGPEVKRRILLGTFVLSSGYQDAYYTKAQQVRRLVRDQFEKAYQSVDCIALPSSTGGAFPLGSKKDPLSMYLEDMYTIGPNLAGLPAISLPSGFLANGMPTGVQIIGPQRGDELVIDVGKMFQQHTSHHLPRN